MVWYLPICINQMNRFAPEESGFGQGQGQGQARVLRTAGTRIAFA